jgi:hypothetical protein
MSIVPSKLRETATFLRAAAVGRTVAPEDVPKHLLAHADACDEAAIEMEQLNAQVKIHCDDWAHDHTHAQNVAKRLGVPAEQVHGDGENHEVPGIADLIDMIAGSVTKL